MNEGDDSWDVSQEWWKEAFDELYLQTDARSVCDEDVTIAEVNNLCRFLGPDPGQRVLDLCGGHGRHLRHFYQRGYRKMFLLDYSWPLLKKAAWMIETELHPGLVKGDARRLPFSSDSFDLVLLLGNSFGLFFEEEENNRILQEVFRILKPEGRFLLDIIDPDYLRLNFRPRSVHRSPGGLTVIRERTMTRTHISARETVLNDLEEVLKITHYAFRFYEEEVLRETLLDYGFSRVRVIRDFSGHRGSMDCGFMENRQLVIGVR